LIYFIDSNVFFYAKMMDRDYGSACAEIMRKIVRREIRVITSVLVVIEFANALRKYGLSKEIKESIGGVYSLNISIYEVDSIDVRSAIDFFNEFLISPYDCTHLAVMKKAGVSNMISADKDFDKVDWIKRSDPKFVK